MSQRSPATLPRLSQGLCDNKRMGGRGEKKQHPCPPDDPHRHYQELFEAEKDSSEKELAWMYQKHSIHQVYHRMPIIESPDACLLNGLGGEAFDEPSVMVVVVSYKLQIRFFFSSKGKQASKFTSCCCYSIGLSPVHDASRAAGI